MKNEGAFSPTLFSLSMAWFASRTASLKLPCIVQYFLSFVK